MKKVVFDTNVWISAIVFRGRVRRLRDEAVLETIQVKISPDILEETLRILSGPKFQYSSGELAKVELEIRELAQVVRPTEDLEIVKNDPSDDRVLECAVEAGAEFIISGDRHLLSLGLFRGIRIIAPGVLLDMLEGERNGRGEGTTKEGPPSAHEVAAAYGTPARKKRKPRAVKPKAKQPKKRK